LFLKKTDSSDCFVGIHHLTAARDSNEYFDSAALQGFERILP
jgi:hypothetical protein